MHETKSLILRYYKSSDDDNLLEYWNDADIQSTANANYPVPVSPAESQRRLTSNTLMRLIIVEKSTGDFAGCVSLQWGAGGEKNRDARMGISLMPTKQRKGYGTEAVDFVVGYAFRALGLHRVSLDVFEGNPAGQAVYKKCGFVEEGRRRKALWRQDGWEDVICMGILETEWRKRKLTSSA